MEKDPWEWDTWLDELYDGNRRFPCWPDDNTLAEYEEEDGHA